MFTRHLYAYARNDSLLPHYHIRITNEMRLDLEMWLKFLHHPSVYSRPFADFKKEIQAHQVDMYSDVSGNSMLGMGVTCGTSWCYKQWDKNFMLKHKPSIEYLELYAVLVGIVNWVHRFSCQHIILFCAISS